MVHRLEHPEEEAQKIGEQLEKLEKLEEGIEKMTHKDDKEIKDKS